MYTAAWAQAAAAAQFPTTAATVQEVSHGSVFHCSNSTGAASYHDRASMLPNCSATPEVWVMQRHHLIITGGTGYIGARLARTAIARGFDVTALARSPRGLPEGARFVPWQLGEPLPASAVAYSSLSNVLVHLAHAWSTSTLDGDESTDVNVAGTRVLLHSSQAQQVRRFVFVSSQSARADALNLYGRVKYRIEECLHGGSTIAVRVGLVYGGAAAGLFGLMLRLAGLPILPMVGATNMVQPIHVDEVCDALLLLTSGCSTGRVHVASPAPMTFGAFLKLLACECHAHSLPIVPVPLSPILSLCRLTEYLPFVPTVDRERVLGLAGVRVMETAEDLANLGLIVRPVTEHLRHSPAGRKGLLVEGRTLLRYVLGGRPSTILLRRYARAIRKVAPQSGPMGFTSIVIIWPATLRFIERLQRDGTLERRLDVAAALLEASPLGARALFGGPNRSRVLRILEVLAELSVDAIALPVRVAIHLLGSGRDRG